MHEVLAQLWPWWLAAGFLTAGLVIWFRQLPPRLGLTAVMALCLLFWWLVVIIEAIALLGYLAWFVFNPDGGPLAMLAALARATSKHPGTPAAVPKP